MQEISSRRTAWTVNEPYAFHVLAVDAGVVSLREMADIQRLDTETVSHIE